ncbi:MAG: RIP metalloprotease RseP [Acidobacteria bacterium]|nr:RIP metalloprotease RseP [Acidobacteriota bacterium]MBU4307066.1 RIP metalloprotease RseP [Acidobacteriota bacterium]MCG2810954.1 RIP metalloprotease RseP [Candidatus Aminicenantes bacterium]
MNIIYQFLTFLFVLGIIVLVHEFGHYVAARLMKIRVEVFSFGFGKRLFGKKIGATDFRVSLFPLGGYVRMAGEEEYDPQNPRPDEFMAKNRAQKIFTLLLGPIMNIVLAFVILTIINLNGVEKEKYRFESPRLGYVVKDSPAAKADLRCGDLIVSINNQRIKNWEELEYMTHTRVKDVFQIVYQREGKQSQTHLTVSSQPYYEIGYAGWYYGFKTRIDAIEPGSPAERAGLKPDDEIVAINQQPVYFMQITDVIEVNANKQIELSILRLKNKLNLTVVPEMKNNRGKIGVSLKPIGPTMIVRYGFFRSLSESGKSLVNMTTILFQVLRKMIVGKISVKSFSGPIEIARISQQALESGFSNFFMLIAFISLQLGIINLFPIPGLDGGHLLIFTIEAIIRRDLNQKLKTVMIYAGFAFLISLMVFIILNDIAKTLPNGWQSIFPFLR